MKIKTYRRSAFAILISTAALLGPVLPMARGQAINGYAYQASNFKESAPRGFGDFNNSWPQAMIWWNNNLYVGTSRDSLCQANFAVNEAGSTILGQAQANTYLPYPPNDPNLTCSPNPADLPLAAQIWRYSPVTGIWQQVFESPTTLPNPGEGPPNPALPGKFLPYDVAIRGFSAFTESDGTQALYAFGVNSTLTWYRGALPPPRILRTTDGVNWTPVPQDPGTFLGDLPFNADHGSYRSPVSFNGKLFVLSGPIFGQGSLIGSANPSQGDNAWFLASDPTIFFYELAVFNGYLYLGGYDPTHGYEVFKTNAQGPPPYPLTVVVPAGAGLTTMPSGSVVSMFVHYGRLYVGTATFPEMVRINADDTWDLVMGAPRIDPVTNQWKYPTSNIGPGFGLTLNDHVWYQDDPNNYLYAGTYNASTASHLDPVNGPLLQPTMGGQLFVTPDDYYWNAVTTNGFSNPSDPHGGMWDFGIRTMATTPYGMFLGTTNDYYGLEIFNATKGTSPPVQIPGRLDVEPAQGGGALLSWLSAINATSYQVWRAPLLPIQVRIGGSFEGSNGFTGPYIHDVYVGPYQLIGTTASRMYLDNTTQAGSQYEYYIVGVSSKGLTSPQSNLVTLPVLLPPVTFASLQSEVTTLANRHRFTTADPQGTQALSQIVAAKNAASSCQISSAISLLTPQATSRAVLVPDQVDYQVLIAKMIRRLQVYNTYPMQVITSEFCTGG